MLKRRSADTQPKYPFIGYALPRRGGASTSRKDGAESIHSDLEPFFSRTRSETEEPTESEVEKDIRALHHSKRDGKVVIENVKPKVTGGVHEVVDTQYAGSAQFKETEEGKKKNDGKREGTL